MRWLRDAVDTLSYYLSGHWRAPRPFTTEAEREALKENRGPGWAYVKMLDSKGNVLEEGWEFTPPPERFERDGLYQVGSFVQRLFDSQNWFPTLAAFTLDEEIGLSLWKREGQLEFNLSFTKAQRAAEARVRALFRAKGISPSEDRLIMGSTRCLAWIVPGDPESVTELFRLIATEGLGIQPEDGLEVQFQEHEDKAEDPRTEGGVTFMTSYPGEWSDR